MFHDLTLMIEDIVIGEFLAKSDLRQTENEDMVMFALLMVISKQHNEGKTAISCRH